MQNLTKTQEFFSRWGDYHRLVDELDTYRFTVEALRGQIQGRVLDVGNGGVFNYDVAAAEEVVVVDLAKELVEAPNAPPGVTFRWGSAMELPVEDNTFDICLLQFLIHHLAEDSFALTRQCTRKAIEEAYRTLKPGGKLLIVESCLPKVWEIAERLSFPLFRFFLRRIGHPVVFQWNWWTLADLVREAGFEKPVVTPVPLGRWVIQLGRKWPTALTPIRIYKIVALKQPA